MGHSKLPFKTNNIYMKSYGCRNGLVVWIHFLALTFYAQNSEINGIIIDKESGNAIPYGTIYNYTTKSGTKCNERGVFTIKINSKEDSLVVSSLGYKRLTLYIKDLDSFKTFKLEPYSNTIQPIVIKAQETAPLFQLIESCKEHIGKHTASSKAYYELKTKVENKQIELVESYYNVDIEGLQLKETHLKAGRIALQKEPINNRYFTTQEMTTVMKGLNIFKENSKFPTLPLALSSKKLKKLYYLDIKESYLNNEKDSIVMILATPKQVLNEHFRAKIWMNCSVNRFEKIELECLHTTISPFVSINEWDTIQYVDMKMTYDYENVKSQQLFHQLDFTLNINYKSKGNPNSEKQYNVNTQAIMYVYDFDTLFKIPIFQFSSLYYPKDYAKINAFPYNSFFWEYNSEPRLHANKKDNDLFFNDTASITNLHFINSPDQIKKITLFKRPFTHWSPKRTIFQEDLTLNGPQFSKEHLQKIHQELSKIKPNPEKVDMIDFNLKRMYGATFKPAHFSIKMFMDYNKYKDSVNILTKTILDPNETSCYLLMDNQTHCYINMLFDINELVRRKFEHSLSSQSRDYDTVLKYYELYNKKRLNSSQNFINETVYGHRRAPMYDWNNFIRKELGINNMELFRPYYEDEEKEKEERE